MKKFIPLGASLCLGISASATTCYFSSSGDDPQTRAQASNSVTPAQWRKPYIHHFVF